MKITTGIESKVLAFGQCAEITGNEFYVPAEQIIDVAALKEYLFLKFPETRTMKFSISVNRKIVKQNTEIPPDAEIALLPPFSGG